MVWKKSAFYIFPNTNESIATGNAWIYGIIMVSSSSS